MKRPMSRYDLFRKGRPLALIRVCVIAVATWAATGELQADTTHAADTRQIETLLEFAGVPVHLIVAGKTISEEASQAYSACLTANDAETVQSKKRAFESLIQRHFGENPVNARAVRAMSGELTKDQINAANAFFTSDLGQRIVNAERAPAKQSENEFEAVVHSYLNSEHWDLSRHRLIAQLTKATRAIRFVSAVNVETSVAVQVSSLCQPTAKLYDEQLHELEQLRADTRMIEPMMALDLNPVIGVVFRNLSDEDLRDYLDFARDSAGDAFFSAVVRSVQHGIAGGLVGLKDELLQ